MTKQYSKHMLLIIMYPGSLSGQYVAVSVVASLESPHAGEVDGGGGADDHDHQRG